MSEFFKELAHRIHQGTCAHRSQVRRIQEIEETPFTQAETRVYYECMNCLKETKGLYFPTQKERCA